MVSFTRPMAHWLISRLMSSVSGFWFKYNKVVCFLLIYRKLIDLAPVREGNSAFKVFSITFAFFVWKKDVGIVSE